MTPEQKTQYLLENNRTMTIATADASGKPWVSPVFYSYDKDYNLYWVSDKNARHSKNVVARPQVSISIFGQVQSGEGLDGVFFDAEAVELLDKKEIEHAIKMITRFPQEDRFTIKDINDVTDKACWRIYKARPKEVTKRGDRVDKLTGQAITIRELVDLLKLQ